LVNFDNADQEFEQIPVLTDRDAAVLYLSHPLAPRDYVTFEDIREEDFIGLGTTEALQKEKIRAGDLVRPLFIEGGGGSEYCV
jgi:hypothetical protein